MTHDELLEKIIGMSKKHAEWVLLLDDLLTDKTKALRAVVELHRRDVRGNCDICTWITNGGLVSYPCPTIQAIEKELG